jgi:hypothetical protein
MKEKLSDAIRHGSEIHRQGYGNMFIFRVGEIFSCAIGAAYYSQFGKVEQSGEEVRKSLYALYPELLREVLYKPDQEDIPLIVAITNMNDLERKSREEIADWLAEMGY